MLKNDNDSDNDSDDNKNSSSKHRPAISGSFICMNSFGSPYSPVK